jgi:hypothetical protein
MNKSKSVLIYSRGETGHRGAYIKFVSDMLLVKRESALGIIFGRNPAFFLMIEDSFSLYVLACLWRRLWGRLTVGLMFRPGPALEGKTARLRVKRWTLKLLKKLSNIQTLTIVPFSLKPEFSNIADDWIYDFQLWDMIEDENLQENNNNAKPLLDIQVAANGRKIISALGFQDRHKGFDVFADAWNKNAEVRSKYLFGYGGKVVKNLGDLAENFIVNGGFALNRRITDEELFGCYAASDAIWCLYDVEYDQASGILGRAVQFGIPVIVRRGSLSHKFCAEEGAPHIATDADMIYGSLELPLPLKDTKLGAKLSTKFRRMSLDKLCNYLGLMDQLKC